jgi:peptidoglycan hydrolase-like protein with peptidoglycan-binding domain
MKQALVAMLAIAVSAAGPAAAQAPAPKAAPAPKSAAKPAPLPAADPARAAATAERLAIQSDLAWVGDYNGAVTGEANDRTTAAIKAFQTRNGGKATGTLTAAERATLTTEAKTLQDHAGWKMTEDANGMRLGIPAKLAPQQAVGKTGTRWTSAQGQVQIETWRVKDAGLTLAAVAEREKKEPAGRKADYSVVRPDFFVHSGLQGLKKFYVRGQIKDNEVRGLTILYDQATEGVMTPVVVAMSSAFSPFPGAATAAAGTPQLAAPPPRRKVEYSTGVVVSADGAILADRTAIEACQSITVHGHGRADPIAEDKARGLALLRIYGAAGLKPLGLVAGDAKPDLLATGVADPQAQGGNAAVSVQALKISVQDNAEPQLSPAPSPGFSGAPVFDREGKFAGLAAFKLAVVAGPAPTFAATLVPASAVRTFLAAHNISAYTAATDPKWSVLRVICVRK